MSPVVSFVAGSRGLWEIVSVKAIAGPSLDAAAAVDVREDGPADAPSDTKWILRGVASYQRYVTREEDRELKALQEPLGRPASTDAVLIPILKSDLWWALPQDERREIFEERSHHIRTGLDALPAVARQLYHGRDLGEPFDFLTWFEFAPDGMTLFDELLHELRATPEWDYVEREVEVHLRRTEVPHD